MLKIKKLFISILIACLFINIFSNPCNANTFVKALSPTVDPNEYQPDEITQSDADVVFLKAGVVLGTILNIASVVSVVALMIIGVKYMLGSVEEKANYKQTMLPYIIGFVLALSGTTVVSFIYNSVK